VLTDQEAQIVNLIADDRSNREIADEPCLSERTVNPQPIGFGGLHQHRL
jgi:DNA-binding CsgD family transcriptional regulator